MEEEAEDEPHGHITSLAGFYHFSLTRENSHTEWMMTFIQIQF